MLKAARLVGLMFGRNIFEFGNPGSTGSSSGCGLTVVLRLGRYYRSPRAVLPLRTVLALARNSTTARGVGLHFSHTKR